MDKSLGLLFGVHNYIRFTAIVKMSTTGIGALMNKKRILEDKLFKPPDIVFGMKKLDKVKFLKDVEIPCIFVPVKHYKEFVKTFKIHKLDRKIKPTGANNIPHYENTKLLLLTPGSKIDNFTDLEREKLNEFDISEIHSYKTKLSYSDYTRKDILRGILPQEEISNSFTQVGHIVHLNLREHLLEYKSLIGQVMLETIHNAKTVVNKTSSIDNTFRNFSMEVLAGEENFITRVVEDGFKYDMDYSKVFWNTRLQTERDVVCKEITRDKTIFDVFAGIGPFAIRLAKKGCRVFANDLNSDSVKWMDHNAKLNNVQLSTFNVDGREFIQSQISSYIISNSSSECKIAVIMNLPAISVEFLDSFRGLLNSSSMQISDLKNTTIEVFCYTFLKCETKEKYNDVKFVHNSIKENLNSAIGCELPHIEIHNTRRVAPGKDMYRCRLLIPNHILFADNSQKDTNGEPDAKKVKITQSE